MPMVAVLVKLLLDSANGKSTGELPEEVIIIVQQSTIVQKPWHVALKQSCMVVA